VNYGYKIAEASVEVVAPMGVRLSHKAKISKFMKNFVGGLLFLLLEKAWAKYNVRSCRYSGLRPPIHVVTG